VIGSCDRILVIYLATTSGKEDIMATESMEEHGKNNYITKNLPVFFRGDEKILA
jgi:hypothetical protein